MKGCVNLENKGLVSIIMPSWNTGEYILDSINSVINQTYANWELIVVDDASTDNTLEMLKKINDRRVKVIVNDTNMGAALTRNVALKAARGEWIAFLDSDDLWLPEKLEHMLNFMVSNNYVFAYHDYEKIDEDSNKLEIIVSGPNVVTKKKMYNYGYPGCLTFMYKVSEYGLVQIKNIKKNNDYAILLKLCKKASCYRLPENLAQYRIRAKSISHDKLIKKLRSHFDLFYICDEKNALVSLWYASWNMFYGVLKKIKYENSNYKN